MRNRPFAIEVTKSTATSISTRKKLLATSVSLLLASSVSAKNALPPTDFPLQPATLQPTGQAVQELLIIDTRVEDYQQLIDLRRKPLIPIVVRPEQDGLDVLTEALARFPNITALHLVSHGEEGKILLGKGWIDEQSLIQRSAVLHTLMRRSSPKRPDLLLYGCDVASTDSGIRFIKRLNSLTGFDVAASVDSTGEASRGGNWQLEKQIGNIDTRLAWSEQHLPAIQGTLAIYTVTNLNDAGAGSLREAISSANSSAGADEIQFSGAGASGTITLTSGELTISDDLTITGPGSAELAISGNNASRVINIPQPVSPAPPVNAVTISGITIKEGKTTVGSAPGGGIYSNATNLTIQDSVITGNGSNGDGGGIFHNGSGSSGTAGSITLTNVQLNNNSSGQSGGALAVDSRYTEGLLDHVTAINNSATFDGGGLRISNVYQRSLTIRNSTISSNSADDDGGGISVSADYADFALIDSTVSNNSAGDDGGGIQSLADYGSFLISGSSISNNTTAVAGTNSWGGGFVASSTQHLSMTIRNSTISGNRVLGTGKAGGIFHSGSYFSSLAIVNSSISNNSVANGNAGGIYMYSYGISSSISNSTISGNTASANNGGLQFIGTYSGYATGTAAHLSVSNTTISGNTATNGSGGGVSLTVDNYSSTTLDFVTLTGNTAYSIGGLFRETKYQLDVAHSILAGNTATDGVSAPDFSNVIGNLTLSYTLIGDTTGSGVTATSGTGLILDQDPLLGALANNGGTTLTHMPNVFSSPVIDAGDPAATPPPLTDQRGSGYKRALSTPPGTAIVDMGAVEIPGCVGSTLTVPPLAHSPGVKLSCHASVSLEVGTGTAVTSNAIVHYYSPNHRVASGSTFSVESGSRVSFSAPMFTPVP